MEKKSLTVGSLKDGVSRAEHKQNVPIRQLKKQVGSNQGAEQTERRRATESARERTTTSAQRTTAFIRLLQKGTEFTVRPVRGKLLLDTALEQGQTLQFTCRKGTCGACTVNVLDGGAMLGASTTQEQKKLGKALGDGFRLACQAVVDG